MAHLPPALLFVTTQNMKAMIRRLAQSIFLCFTATSARAQTSSASSETQGFWAEIGAGVGKSASAKGNAAVSAAVEWQRGHQLWSFRGDAVSKA